MRVLRARYPLAHGQQRGEQVPGGGQIPHLSGQAGELLSGGQGVRVIRAENLLEHGQQLGVLVPGGSRIPRQLGPAGEVGAGG